MGEKARGERESDRRSRLRGEGETDKRQWAKERAAREREYACEESATSAPGIGTAGAETRPETRRCPDRRGDAVAKKTPRTACERNRTERRPRQGVGFNIETLFCVK